MFQPSTAFTYQNSIANKGKLPDLSPEARISDQDQQNLAFFAKQVLNGTLGYLIINVYGSGANLPVSSFQSFLCLLFTCDVLSGIFYLHYDICVYCDGPGIVRFLNSTLNSCDTHLSFTRTYVEYNDHMYEMQVTNYRIQTLTFGLLPVTKAAINVCGQY